MGAPILEARHISKRFVGVQALDDVSVTINKGEIRCLAGENGSGKSTFVKIVAGVHAPDSGELIVNGTTYQKLTPIEAIREGVQVIYQDLSLFPHMSVAENIAMNKLVAQQKRFVKKKEIDAIAEEQLQRIGVPLDLRAEVATLSIANQQLVAICRALSLNAKILFMDEPTTALTKKEVGALLSIVSELKSKGLTIIFISHKLDEVFEVSDYITVFRDGKKVGDFSARELTPKSLSRHMTGRSVEYPRYRRSLTDDAPLLEINKLTKKGHYENIDLSIRRGDILGVIGLLGSGRTELALSLFGLNPPDSGTILLKGKPVSIDRPMDAVDNGIALLPEDRHRQGLFMKQSVKDNITSTILNELATGSGVIDKQKQEKISSEQVAQLRIRTHSVETSVRNLSGGNQQKVVIAKWIVTKPEVFILDTPTVGVDIGSKAEIYEQIQQFANKGMGVILISDELDEVLANCNKIMVMYNGKVSRFLNEDELENLSDEQADAIIMEAMRGETAEGTSRKGDGSA